MVTNPRDYPWSSYRFNAEGRRDELITAHEEYWRLDEEKLQRRKVYPDLFRAHIDTDIDNQIISTKNGNYVLGDKRFQNEISRMLDRRVTKDKAGRPKIHEAES